MQLNFRNRVHVHGPSMRSHRRHCQISCRLSTKTAEGFTQKRRKSLGLVPGMVRLAAQFAGGTSLSTPGQAQWIDKPIRPILINQQPAPPSQSSSNVSPGKNRANNRSFNSEIPSPNSAHISNGFSFVLRLNALRFFLAAGSSILLAMTT